nr:hypothetical protein [Phaeobacter sp. CECT 5382]
MLYHFGALPGYCSDRFIISASYAKLGRGGVAERVNIIAHGSDLLSDFHHGVGCASV